MTAHPLDNAAWHSLTTAHQHLAEHHGRARRYPADVSPFAAVDRVDDGAWADLATLAGPTGRVVLFRDVVPAPPVGWREVLRGTGHQLVLADRGLAPVPRVEVVELGEQDGPRMVELATLTEPGPFLLRTVTLGRYHGYVHGGRLVAMAGERLHPEGFSEISAVCTHPDARGRGLAAALTHHLATEALARGERPFLHVASTNVAAERLYRRLGFELRRTVDFVALVPPAPSPTTTSERPATRSSRATA